jgi:ribose transport system permease protein
MDIPSYLLQPLSLSMLHFNKLLGIALFLVLLYIALLAADPNAGSLQNHLNLGTRVGHYGIIALGAGLLIISGGIDLSIGSVVGLAATLLAILMKDKGWPPALAMLSVLGLGTALGIMHGLLVTKLSVQPFVVTLCGLFIYRGVARWIGDDAVKGLGRDFEEWKYVLNFNRVVFGLPMFLVILLVLLAVATVFLHYSVYGRYLFAIGSNEQAARYSGIATDRYKIMAYALCSGLAALFGILSLTQDSAEPAATGLSLELYAIGGAVLGGCSLRGGEGTVLGILIGTCILVLLPNFNNMWGIPSQFETIVIGAALLLGAILDEVLRRRGASKGGV